jgi:hypothetical protein
MKRDLCYCSMQVKMIWHAFRRGREILLQFDLSTVLYGIILTSSWIAVKLYGQYGRLVNIDGVLSVHMYWGLTAYLLSCYQLQRKLLWLETADLGRLAC